MTPKEKAQELVDKFIPHTRVFHEVLGWEDYIDSAKQCALLAVQEVELEQCKSSEKKDAMYQDERLQYWLEVKQEIEKL